MNKAYHSYELFNELKDCVNTYIASVKELRRIIIMVRRGKLSIELVDQKIDRVRRSREKLINILKKIENNIVNIDSTIAEDTALLAYFIEMSTAKDEIFLLKKLSRMNRNIMLDNDIHRINELRDIAMRVSTLLALD